MQDLPQEALPVATELEVYKNAPIGQRYTDSYTPHVSTACRMFYSGFWPRWSNRMVPGSISVKQRLPSAAEPSCLYTAEIISAFKGLSCEVWACQFRFLLGY